MKVTNAGVPVEELITTVKEGLNRAGVSSSSSHGDLRVESVQLVLQALASKTAGGELDFRIPFIGMKLAQEPKSPVRTRARST